MSWIGRLINLFRRDRISSELDEELASHIDEAVAHGRSAADARRAFGGALQYRERSRDIQLLPWLDALTSDVVFGWRQIRRNRAASAAAILSLALAIGATTAAFRLVDAVLWRTLPVAHPEQLFFITTTNIDRDGRPDYRDDFDYPSFRRHRELIGDRADVLLVGASFRQDVILAGGAETEKVYRQHISGNLFGVFGLQPAAGRLLAPNDDVTPGGHPIAVLSYDYWTRRFGRDPQAVGKTFRMGSRQYEIVGVAPKGFIGTQPGTVTEIFIPATMNTEALDRPGWSWLQIWVRPKAGFALEQIRQPLQAALEREHQERIKKFDSDTPKQTIDAYLRETVQLLPAASGASPMQKAYRRPLLILGILVALVLLVACANVGNLLTAQATARAREMALRVSIGAGQRRLIQLVLVESALLAIIASAAGMVFSSWSAPLVVSLLAQPNDPVRLVLDTDWRAIGFGIALTISVTLLFGLAPALRASAVKPIRALKGGDDPHARRRFMNTLVAAQMAFCVLVLFVASLFVATFERLSNRPLGFSHKDVLVMDIESGKQSPEAWLPIADRLRLVPGVQSVARSGWPLLSGNRWSVFIRVPGRPVDPRSPYCLDVSPGFFETMRIGLIDGREFRPGDVPPRLSADNRPVAGAAIVNESFARIYFDGQNPLGRPVDVRVSKDLSAPLEIVGYVRDAAYGNVREPIRPTVYVPIETRSGGSVMVRTSGNPLALAPVMRREVSQAGAGLRVRYIGTQTELVRRHMIRERLLAALSLFFAIVALLLAAIGLYGVLNYSVVQQRREIGIRIALGAGMADVMRRVTAGLFAMMCLGAAAGLTAGIASERFVQTLLFEVKATDPGIVVLPILALFAAAVLAGLPPAIRAVRIDPAQTLRGE